MMPAAKHFDPVLGVDIHIIQPPGPVPPVPIPHPFVGFIIDPFDYVPILGSTVNVNGVPRAQAGTAGKCVPPHIPIGGVFVKPPANECEMFMGSSTVSVDGDAFSYLALPALSCQDIGMPPIPRLKKKSKIKSLLLPTSVVLPIPAGPPVLVGGSPTISLMGLAMKLGMAGLMRGLGRLARSGVARRMMAAFRRGRQRMFRNMRPGFLRCVILRAEPVDITSGENVIEQQDFELRWPLPLTWTRRYSSHSTRLGLCGYGWDTPADSRLVVESTGTVLFYDGTAGNTLFPSLPEHGPVREFVDGAVLHGADGHLQVRLKSGLTYHFGAGDSGGAEYSVERITDRCGNSLTFRRDAGGLREIVSNVGPRLEVVSQEGRIHKLILHHPLEEKPRTLVRYEYSKEADLREVYDALQNPYRFYYRNHCLIRHTDRNGLSFYYEFDDYTAEGRVLHTWGDGGLYNYHFKYDTDVGLVHITDSLGHITVVELNAFGLPVAETDPLGGVTQYEYDEMGRTATVIDPGGHRTEYQYDERGNLLKLSRPDGKSIQTEYNEANHTVKITDPNGAVWRQDWDARGLLLSHTSPLGNVLRYEYDGSGRLVAFTNARGARTTLAFDQFGNLTWLVDALGHSTRFAYDALGNVTAKTDSIDRHTAYAYDLKGRIVEMRRPSGAAIRCGYDSQDKVRWIDENGAQTRLEYSGLGEVKRRIQPDGHFVEYMYDSEERLTGVTNQRGETYQLKRDALGRIIEEIDYWGQSRHYDYTVAGHLRRSLDPLGRAITYTTDSLGRILRKSLPDPDKSGAPFEESFEYDGNGNLIACANPHIRIERKFDPDGRLLEEKQGEDFTIRNAYDGVGNRIRRQTALALDGVTAGHTVQYTYDSLDRAVEIFIDDHEPVKIERDAAGQIIAQQWSLTTRRQLEYTGDGYLTRQSVCHGTDVLVDVTYRYDAAGNLIERHDAEFGIDKYTYDPLGRITEHLDPQGAIRRSLNDPAGDRLQTRIVRHAAAPPEERPGGTQTAWSREGEHEGAFYRFDQAGNLVSRRNENGELGLTWDANQRLVESCRNNTPTRYRYDPLGRRVDKCVNGSCARLFWDGDVIAGDARAPTTSTDSNAEIPAREWAYLPKTFELLAMVIGEAGSGSILHYQNDPNGSPICLTDCDGEIKWSARYTVTGGVETPARKLVENPHRLMGQYYDEELEMSYNRHRYFDSSLGMFVSQDPLRLSGGLNIYQFAPNVLTWVDPLGLACRLHARNPKELHAAIREQWGHTMNGAEMREIQNTVDRIRGRNPHFPNDMTEFRNDWRMGPDSQRLNTSDVYEEWTVRTPNVGGQGQRRIVVDRANGRAYYSHDHYDSYVEVDLAGWN